jgi:hypothetical protein
MQPKLAAVGLRWCYFQDMRRTHVLAKNNVGFANLELASLRLLLSLLKTS